MNERTSSEAGASPDPAILKHRHAKRARVIFLVIGVFVELFTVMVRLSFFWLRCTARKKLGIYDVHAMLHR